MHDICIGAEEDVASPAFIISGEEVSNQCCQPTLKERVCDGQCAIMCYVSASVSKMTLP